MRYLINSLQCKKGLLNHCIRLQINKSSNSITQIQIRMGFSYALLRYYLTNFRTRQSYLLFQIFQLLLSAIIIITAIFSDDMFRQATVLWLQFILLLSMIIDLFLIRFISQGRLFKYKRNIIDLLIIIIFVVTLIVLCVTENKVKEGQTTQYEVLIQTDDIILITIIVARYAVQIFQMVKTIRNTKKNIQCVRKMKDIDLNKTPNISVLEEGNDAAHQEIIRKRIQARKLQNQNNIKKKQQNSFN